MNERERKGITLLIIGIIAIGSFIFLSDLVRSNKFQADLLTGSNPEGSAKIATRKEIERQDYKYNFETMALLLGGAGFIVGGGALFFRKKKEEKGSK